VPADFAADGIVAWGRWTGGQSNFSSAENKLATLHYVALQGTPVLPVVRGYASFGSTAPTLSAADGSTLAVGTPGSVTGALNVNFSGASGGSVDYRLNVPLGGQTYLVQGTATQTGSFGFAGPAALISASGNGCQAGCSGALAGGNAVQGLVGGDGNSRAGAVFGFGALQGTVSGAVVFKPR
jgi:hypothetical protein